MLSEDEFKKRFKAKLMALVNDWFFNKERGDKVIQDNYDMYLEDPENSLSPEEFAVKQFASWSERGYLKEC